MFKFNSRLNSTLKFLSSFKNYKYIYNNYSNVSMIDISNKKETNRSAVAMATVKLPIKVLKAIKEKKIKKGDLCNVTEIAGIMGAKKTSEILPLCHPIMIEKVKIEIEINDEKSCLIIKGEVKTYQKTGVEMEALVAVSVAAMNVYDMCKYMTNDIIIENIKLINKLGGKKDYNGMRDSLIFLTVVATPLLALRLALNIVMKDDKLWPINGPLDPDNMHMRQQLSRKKLISYYFNQR